MLRIVAIVIVVALVAVLGAAATRPDSFRVARTATIQARTELRCYGMTSWDFRPLVEDHADIAWKLLQAVARKIRDAERR